jgi:hypothetical protein
MTHTYKPGSWNAICDLCGFKFKSDQLRKRWDGLMACEADWEMRNPQEFIKVPKDNPSTPWQRPEATDTFVSVTFRPINSTTKDVTPP